LGNSNCSQQVKTSDFNDLAVNSTCKRQDYD